MTKRDLVFPFILIGAGLVFVLASIALRIYRGKSPFFTSLKIKTGAVLLSIGSFAACNGGGQVTCYDVALSDYFRFDNEKSGTLSIRPDSSTAISGTIVGRNSDKYSFRIADENGRVFQKAEIYAADQAFDSIDEVFNFEIDKTIPQGRYSIFLFSSEVAKQDSARYKCSSVNLEIVK